MDYYSPTNVTFQFIGDNTVPVNIKDVNQYIKVWEQVGTPSPYSLTQNRGNFNDTVTYHDYPIKASDHSGLGHIDPDNINLNLSIKYQGANLTSNNYLQFINSIFTINDNITFTNNYKYGLHITGQDAKFISGNNSVLNSVFEDILYLENGATIEANGTIFQSSNSGIWWGISLDNPKIVNINFCTFNNAVTAISINNSNINGVLISNNTFNIPLDYINVGILIENGRNITILKNIFTLPVYDGSVNNTAIQIINGANSEEDNNLAPWFNINILDNEFYDGMFHIVAGGIADNLAPINILRNNFHNGLRNISLIYSCGNISENTIISSTGYENDHPYCIYLEGGFPNFLNNTIQSINNNFDFNTSCFPNLAPLRISENQYLWKGGKNKLTTYNHNNIWAPDQNSPGYFYTDYGKNEFNISSSNSWHMYGYLSDNGPACYESNGNCWNGNNGYPKELLLHSDNSEYPFCYDPQIDCNFDEQIVDNIISNLGNGIYDTILISQSNSNLPINNDEALFATGVKNSELKNYSTAILNFKNLINSYPESKYIGSSVSYLYKNNVLSDTNHTQNWRNILFGDLKNYLENKIQLYDTNAEFINTAFDYYLKCAIKTKNYTIALDGYQYITNNSPSANERFLASINYIEVEGLIQGSGEGQNDIASFVKSYLTKINKPLKEILSNIYSKKEKYIRHHEALELKNSKNVVVTKLNLDNKRKLDKILKERAINNIISSKNLNKKQRREKVVNELSVLLNNGSNFQQAKENSVSQPINYSLSQNYPNPFNPVTKIIYSIEKQGLVTLKIYDILGREIKTLANEVKTPGNYLVEFNGIEFASGVYFYRIQAGKFSQVKRMVLIK